MKKTKIFLGAYVNFPNAQNVNCDNIAKYLDKEKFEVHIMYTSKKPVDKKAYKEAGIHLHRLIHHRFIWFWSKLFTMVLANCDIYYLPKSEPMDKLLAKLFKRSKRVCIASVEGVVTEGTNNTPEYIRYFLEEMDTAFAISKCIAESIKIHWGVDMPVLPLGVATKQVQSSPKDKIQNVIWVGNVKANKRPQYLLEIASAFPQLQFTMIGDGDMQNWVKQTIQKENLQNVRLTGRIPNERVYEHMQKNDILLMTSEFEGLPKVIQEAALCGMPSIYMAENYTVDFLEDGVNGYGVYSLEEMMEKLQYLLNNPTEYKVMALKANEAIQPYTWENLIKQYENYFITQLETKRKGR